MAAKKGNTYAQKYTRESVLETLAQCVETMNTPPYHKTLSHALKLAKINRNTLTYWRSCFKDDSEVLSTIKNLSSEAESNNEIAVADGECPVAWGAFNAKCNFGWIEKGVELEVTGKKNLVQIEYVENKK